jgi:hypothetical protein
MTSYINNLVLYLPLVALFATIITIAMVVCVVAAGGLFVSAIRFCTSTPTEIEPVRRQTKLFLKMFLFSLLFIVATHISLIAGFTIWGLVHS